MSKTRIGGLRIVGRVTDMDTTTTAVADFEVVSSKVEEREEQPTEGAALARTVLAKRFSGALEGTSVTQMLTAVAAGGRGYVASERVEGVLDGRRGSFVLQHGGLVDGDDVSAFGEIIPGSGTGELVGLHGHASYFHEGDVARLTLTYALD